MKKTFCNIIIMSVFSLVFLGSVISHASPARADQITKGTGKPLTGKPLWEVGLLSGAIRMPHYRGADEYRFWAMPLPYLMYRGKIWQLDREGVRGIFYRSEYLETNISGWGNPPMDEDNKAREGMHIPDAVVEVGPSLEWHFNGRKPGRTLYLRCAIRSVISVGFPDDADIQYQGLKSAVNFVYQKEAFWNRHRWHIGMNTGIEFGDRKYHRYFYEVSLADATPNRPAYDPDPGISAFILSFRLIREINTKISIAGYTRWENLSRAAYSKKPPCQGGKQFYGRRRPDLDDQTIPNTGSYGLIFQG